MRLHPGLQRPGSSRRRGSMRSLPYPPAGLPPCPSMATITHETGPLGVLLEYSSAPPLRPHRKRFDFMDSHWNENQPIYRQLRDKVVEMILEGTLAEGDALPSVRNVAADHTLNPLTVLKGYQQLVDEGLVEKKRGRGMFVTA